MNHPCNFCINLWYRRLCTILKETLNAGNYEYKIYKKGKIPEIAINWWPYLKVCNVNSKAKLGYGALVGKKVPFRPKRSLFRSC